MLSRLEADLDEEMQREEDRVNVLKFIGEACDALHSASARHMKEKEPFLFPFERSRKYRRHNM